MLNPEWYAEQRTKAEAHWNNILNAIGPDRAATLLLVSDNDEVNIGVPYKAIEPVGGKPCEFHPDRQFIVNWVAAQRLREDAKQVASQDRALKMQWIALAISAIAAATSVFNAVKSFWGS